MGKIETIFPEGGFMPMPKDDANHNIEKPKHEGFREVSEAILEAEKVRAFKDALSGGDKPPPKSEEKTTVDISAMFQAQTGLTQTLLTQLTDILKMRPEDPYLKHLSEEVIAMKQRLEGVGQTDPVTALTNNMETLKRLTEIMKEHLGIGEAQTQVSDLPRMLQLEQMRIEAAERQRQHEERMAEMRHQHRLENLRWQAEFKLKLLEFEASRKAKEKATGTLEDLFGSLADSIRVERGGGTGSESVEHTAEEVGSVRIPKAYKCEDCGTVIEVPKEQDITEPITCPQCGAIYDLMEME